jgi:rhodanese-related sulfurtransferase
VIESEDEVRIMHDDSKQTVRLYARDEIRRRLRDPSLAIANVLPRAAWEEARIPRSASLPLVEIRTRAHQVLPDREREIAVYCQGPDSALGAQAVDQLQELGYRNVGHYPGGIEEWIDHGEPVESGPDEESEDEGAEEETLEGETMGPAGVARRGSLLRPARFRPVAWIERLADLSYMQLLGTWLGIIVVLAVVYWSLGRLGLGGLRDGGVLLGGDWQGFGSALYFSLITATSIGFGDVVPVGIARLVAVFESAAALLILGCLVSKLASRHQEELSDETHRLAFDTQLGRVRTNLHLVLSELQSIESSLGDRNQTLGLHDPALAHTLTRLESATMVFSSELRTVYDLLYRSPQQPESTVVEGLLANLAMSLDELEALFERIPDARRRSALLDHTVGAICSTAAEICTECVPPEYEVDLEVWMNRIQDLARSLSRSS